AVARNASLASNPKRGMMLGLDDRADDLAAPGSRCAHLRFAPAPIFERGKMNRPLPLVPEDVGLRQRAPRASTYLYRAAGAHIRGYVARTTPERAARELLGNDTVPAEVLRAASSPATIANAGWAGALAETAIDDSIQAMTAISAAAGLIGRGMRVTFD